MPGRIKQTPELRAAIAAALPRPTLESLGLGEPKPRKPRRSMLGTLGGPGPWRIEIQGWHPTLLNRLAGASIGHQTGIKRADAKQLYSHLLGVVPEAKGRRLVRLTLVYRRQCDWPDRDNVWKSLLDGLVKIGALVDDGPEWVEADRPVFDVGGKATILEMEDC